MAPVTPEQVAASYPNAARDMRRGQGMVDTAKSFVGGLPALGRGLAGAANAVLKPFEMAAPSVLRGIGHAQNFVSARPGLGKMLVGGAVMAPILAASANNLKSREESSLLQSSLNPERTVLASLERHHIKTAGFSDALKGFGIQHGPDLLGGAMKSVGGGIGNLFMSGVEGLGKAGLSAMVTGPQREKIFQAAIESDQVLKDAVAHNPGIMTQLTEAFATLIKFAPSLSTDINAVRSYLREAVVSGSGINYATVKQLAETEKMIQDRNRGGKR